MSFEDAVAGFSLEAAPARGRIARLSTATIDPILRRHAYPRPVALLLGEALTLSALIGSLFKFEGRVILQAEGDGPVRLLSAERRSDGGMRGYARLDPEAAAAITVGHALAPAALIGEGVLTLSLDQGGAADLVQGVVPLEGETLAACAESYFLRSEQTPTRIRVAVGEEIQPGHAPLWRAGGVLLQRLAGDAARGFDEAEWETAEVLFSTLQDHELLDAALPGERLLYRLFHEGGVRMATAVPHRDFCPCDRGRLEALMARFSPEELAELAEPDGAITARCQFCAREYRLAG